MFDRCPALVLNADYQPLSYMPLSLWSWQDAVSAVVKKTVTVLAEYDVVARSPSQEMKLPSVVVVHRFVPVSRRVPFTRFNVFLRDGFCCQYCGGRFSPRQLTFDHVVPRSRGGVTGWSNIVAACEGCNTAKDDRPQAPLRSPREPTIGEVLAAQRRFPPNYLHETWLDYLYWDTALESSRSSTG